MVKHCIYFQAYIHGRRFLFNIGGTIERQRRENRGAVGAEGGGVWGGGSPYPLREGSAGGGSAIVRQ